MSLDQNVPMPARELRLLRDTLRGEKVAVAEGEEPFLHDPWPSDDGGPGVSLADRMIALIEARLITADADWPDESEAE